MKLRYLAVISCLTIWVGTSAYAQSQYNLPQVATGNFGAYIYTTTFILFNNSDADVTAALNLSDDNANPMTVTIPGFGTGSQFNIHLPAGATAFLRTDGLGSGVIGAATVTASSPIGVSAVFTIYDPAWNYLTEAGVGASDTVTDFVLPVDSTGSFLTGLALFNPGSDAMITLTLLNTDGSQAGVEPPFTLHSFNHIARFVAAPQQFFSGISNFRGTLRVHSTSPITALVLRQYLAQPKLCYTSLPVVPNSFASLSLNLAQIANGLYGSVSTKTSFLIFNISSSQANLTLALKQDDGSPFIVTIPGLGTNSSFNLVLGAGASVFLQTDGLGAGTSGAATINSNVPVGATAIFTNLDSQGKFKTEAGVGVSPVMPVLTLPVDVTGSSDTGIAFFNPGTSSVFMSLKLLDVNGVIVNSLNQDVAAGHHQSIFVDQLFPGTMNFRGSLSVSASGNLATTALRQYGSGDTFTTLPTISGTASGTMQVSPLLSQTITGIHAAPGDPDIAMSVRLNPGSLISGSVSGAGVGLAVVANGGGNNVFFSQINPLTGNYLIVVPDGTYSLVAYYQPSGVTPPASLVMAYSDPNPVQVTVSAARDIALPSVPLFTVSGIVSGLSNLFAGAGVTIVFTSNDNKIQGQFPLDTSGSYQGVLPAGSYNASVSAAPIQFLPFQSETLQLYNLGSLNVAADTNVANYSIPATAKLLGTLSGGGPLLTSIPVGALVTARDTSAPSVAPSSFLMPPAASSAAPDLSGQYQMALAQSRTFALGVEVPFLLPGTNLPAQILYTPSPSQVMLTGDLPLNISLPPLSPPSVTIFGFVTDTVGHALPNVTVTAYSQSIGGAPNVSFSVTGTTDILGRYSILVLGGSNYRLSYIPPAPKF